jgi:predicted nucleotidyltransferase
MTPEVNALLTEARDDPNVVGVYVMGSQAVGNADADSDWDVVVVVRSGTSSHEKTATMDLVRTTLEELRGTTQHFLPAVAHAGVLLDKTGEVTEVVERIRRVERAELAELYDGYLNDLYRSLKAWRRGRELGARVQSGRSLWWLGEFLIGLDGVRAPYPSAWGGRLGELEPLILEVARTGAPRAQQELCRRVEEVATAHGFRDVYDAWDGDIDEVLALTF